jgi:hypothetical protein
MAAPLRWESATVKVGLDFRSYLLSDTDEYLLPFRTHPRRISDIRRKD